MNEPFDSIAKIFLGALLTALFAIWRERRRDRDARDHSSISGKKERKRKFVAFLKEWSSEISLYQHPGGFGPGVFQKYQSQLPRFHAEVVMLADDFAGDQAFDRLTGSLGGLNEPDMANQSKPQKEIILEAIDGLLKYMEAP